MCGRVVYCVVEWCTVLYGDTVYGMTFYCVLGRRTVC